MKPESRYYKSVNVPGVQHDSKRETYQGSNVVSSEETGRGPAPWSSNMQRSSWLSRECLRKNACWLGRLVNTRTEGVTYHGSPDTTLVSFPVIHSVDMANSFLPACEGRSAERKVSLKTTTVFTWYFIANHFVHRKGFSWRCADRIWVISRALWVKPVGCLQPSQPQKKVVRPSSKTSWTRWLRALVVVAWLVWIQACGASTSEALAGSIETVVGCLTWNKNVSRAAVQRFSRMTDQSQMYLRSMVGHSQIHLQIHPYSKRDLS